MGETRNVYRLLVGKPEGKRPIGRLRRRWIDNIKVDLIERELDGWAWELVNEPSGSIKWCESTEWLHNWWPLE
jgi:hypothetical protein